MTSRMRRWEDLRENLQQHIRLLADEARDGWDDGPGHGTEPRWENGADVWGKPWENAGKMLGTC